MSQEVSVVITHTTGIFFPYREDFTVSIPITEAQRGMLDSNRELKLLYIEEEVSYEVLLKTGGEALFNEDYTKDLTNPVARWSLSPAT